MAETATKENIWENFKISPQDIQFIYNLLLEKAIPLPSEDILGELIRSRIARQLDAMEEQRAEIGNTYFPKDEFQVGDKLIFPALGDQAGQVMEIRDGFNPDFDDLKVIGVRMNSGQHKDFASQVANHLLNEVSILAENDPEFNPASVLEQYSPPLLRMLEESLTASDDLVRIAGRWFPRSLLVDISVGHLNLAEAVLEEMNGGPVTAPELLESLEMDLNADPQLVEFSLNLALQEDERFDEVGPAGVTLWFLRAMEPEEIREMPVYLRYSPPEKSLELKQEFLELFEDNLYDELEEWDSSDESTENICISLNFPHWRAGTLPLSRSLRKMFPTSYEAPRIKFIFIDTLDGKLFPGWVARPGKYVSGLGDWYRRNELMPGSLVTVKKGDKPGEINISFEKSRQNKEWLKTVLVGSDLGIVIAMLKHPITASFNERMAIAIPDIDAVDQLWIKKVHLKDPFDKTILRIMRELSKLNPQGQVHAQELYAAVNVVRRCPPSLIIDVLADSDKVSHLGDLYFTLRDKD